MILTKRVPAEDRFWMQVVMVENCWEWIGTVNSGGYGSFNDGRQFKAHRWSYARFKGPIPPNLTLDHLCRNRRCVNVTEMRKAARALVARVEART